MTTLEQPHVTPAAYIPPPSPEGKRYGLFSIAQMDTDPALRWEMGVEWEPLAGERAGLVSTVCVDPSGLPLDARAGEGLVTALPFAVVGSYKCSAFSRSTEEAENRARQHLSLGEERAVEHAITAGGWDNAPLLVDGVDLTPGGTAVPVDVGFGLLESHLGSEYPGVGAIHAPRLMSGQAWNLAGVHREGQRLETLLGTLVAFGGGYDEAAATPADGTGWLYATGRPVVRRGDVFVTPDADHRPSMTQNDMEIYAQRTYVVGWDGPAARVNVTLGV